MKPEKAEQFLIEELFNNSIDSNSIEACILNSIEKLTGDASTRRYYRIHTNKKNYVVCLDNPSSTNEPNKFILTQKFFKNKTIRVPCVYDFNASKGYILEEDLGDQTLLNQLSIIDSSEIEFGFYKDLIDEMLKIHSIEKNDARIFELKFDANKFLSEIEMTINYFIKDFLGYKDENYCKELLDLFEPICTRLASQKMVLTHRDFHSRNIMVKDAELVLIDFQDARFGIPQYDLASLLDDCYYELNGLNKEKLLKYYYDRIGSSYIEQKSFELFLSLYNDMVIQRAFKAIGSFAYILSTRNDNRYLKYIGFAMEKIKKIMLADPMYNKLRTKLFRVYYGN